MIEPRLVIQPVAPYASFEIKPCCPEPMMNTRPNQDGATFFRLTWPAFDTSGPSGSQWQLKH